MNWLRLMGAVNLVLGALCAPIVFLGITMLSPLGFLALPWLLLVVSAWQMMCNKLHGLVASVISLSIPVLCWIVFLVREYHSKPAAIIGDMMKDPRSWFSPVGVYAVPGPGFLMLYLAVRGILLRRIVKQSR